MGSPVWTEEADQHESLALALRAALSAFDVPADYDELTALLGLGAATVFVEDEPCAAFWPAYLRDVFLAETSAAYGLRVREMHPPTAVDGLSTSQEFAQHFRDSYAPLIRRALGHGQLVLAWRGWEGERCPQWGILLRETGERFQGFTSGCGGRSVALNGPAHQIYVIETIDPADPAARRPARLLADALRRAAAWFNGQVNPSPLFRTGRAAYAAWCRVLAGLPVAPAAGTSNSEADRAGTEAAIREHHDAIRLLAAGRWCLSEWFYCLANRLPADEAKRANAAGDIYRHAAERFDECLGSRESQIIAEGLGGAAEIESTVVSLV